MPRKENATTVSSAIRHVRQQARALLIGLRKEIRIKENDLRRLKEEESRLGMLTGRAQVGAAGITGAAAGRINWRAVLHQLPKQFKASDVRGVRGLKNKRPSEIFAAITRWINARAARRKTRGIYEKLERSS